MACFPAIYIFQIYPAKIKKKEIVSSQVYEYSIPFPFYFPAVCISVGLYISKISFEKNKKKEIISSRVYEYSVPSVLLSGLISFSPYICRSMHLKCILTKKKEKRKHFKPSL